MKIWISVLLLCVCSYAENFAWQRIAQGDFAKRYGHNAVVFQDKIWVFGGTNGRVQNDLWSSTDGINWKNEGNVPCPPREFAGMIVFNQQMWILGGRGSAYYSDVWCSRDGRDWKMVQGQSPWGNRCGFATVVHQDQIVVIGGFTGGAYLNDVWYSADGEIWYLAAKDCPWKNRSFATALVKDNEIWLIGGTNGGGAQKDIWTSRNLGNWKRIESQMPMDGISGHGTVILGNAIVLVAGHNRNYNNFWFTGPSNNWGSFGKKLDWMPHFYPAMVVFHNHVLVIGGKPIKSEVWRLQTTMFKEPEIPQQKIWVVGDKPNN